MPSSANRITATVRNHDGTVISADVLAAGYRTAFGYRKDGSRLPIAAFSIDRNRILTKPQEVIDFLNTPKMLQTVRALIRRKRNSRQPLDQVTIYDFKNWRDSGHLPIMPPGGPRMQVKTGTLIDYFDALSLGHNEL